jgi:hypothetical protein
VTDLPTLKEELDRKALATIEDLLHLHAICKISDAQLSTGIDALFKATSGLTDEEILHIITEASKILPLAPQTLRYVYLSGDNMISLHWIVGDDKVTMTSYRAGKKASEKIHDGDDARAAKLYLQKTRKALTDRGYTLI